MIHLVVVMVIPLETYIIYLVVVTVMYTLHGLGM